MFSIVGLETIFNTEFVGMRLIYFHKKYSSPPSAPSGKSKSCLRAFGLGTLVRRIVICYDVTLHLLVYTVFYPLPSHMYF
jgi:hypothetical protein